MTFDIPRGSFNKYNFDSESFIESLYQILPDLYFIFRTWHVKAITLLSDSCFRRLCILCPSSDEDGNRLISPTQTSLTDMRF